MNAQVTELMDKIGISRQAAIEIVAMDINSSRAEKTIGVPCDIYTRTVGYYATVNSMHKGKQEEVAERKTYKIKRG